MTIQHTLNQQAIDMLPRCAFFLKTFGGNNYRLIQSICSSTKSLEKMNALELNDFDLQQLSCLLEEKMDNEERGCLHRLREEADYLETKARGELLRHP